MSIKLEDLSKEERDKLKKEAYGDQLRMFVKKLESSIAENEIVRQKKKLFSTQFNSSTVQQYLEDPQKNEKELRLLQNPVQQYLNMSEEDRAIAYFTSLKEKKALAEKNNALTEENKQKDQIIGELKPKADYTDVILKSDGLVTISQIAKDYGMSGRKLNGLLHDWKIQFKQGNTWLLYAKYQSKGYTKSYTYYDTINNESRLMTKWTQKGRLFLNDILNKNGIYATIEIN